MKCVQLWTSLHVNCLSITNRKRLLCSEEIPSLFTHNIYTTSKISIFFIFFRKFVLSRTIYSYNDFKDKKVHSTLQILFFCISSVSTAHTVEPFVPQHVESSFQNLRSEQRHPQRPAALCGNFYSTQTDYRTPQSHFKRFSLKENSNGKKHFCWLYRPILGTQRLLCWVF